MESLPRLAPEEQAALLDNTEAFSDDDMDDDVDIGSAEHAVCLLLQALFSLIIRLWFATLSISMLMYFLRRIPLNPLLHHSGMIINDKPVVVHLHGSQNSWVSTPALFGSVLSEPITGKFY